MCLLLQSAAAEHGLPLDFFTRLIRQESGFNPRAVSPVGAQGVAQFMPYTAAERGLLDPFDPVQAIPASADFLRELREEFGNLGLAAAAYNAGTRRVRDWLDGRTASLPWETQGYVRAITGRTVEDWAKALTDVPDPPGPAAAPPRACQGITQALLLPRARAPSGGPPVPGAPRDAGGRWGVHLTADSSQAKALSEYAALQRRFRSVLGDRAPKVLRTRLGGSRVFHFYRVAVGERTREAADRLCARLRTVGGSCVVLRN